MSAWHYGWLAQEGEDLRTGEKFPHMLYMRTMWEDMADGMGRPHTEVLGMICLMEPDKVWNVYVQTHRGLFERTDSLEAAKRIVEDYHKRHSYET